MQHIKKETINKLNALNSKKLKLNEDLISIDELTAKLKTLAKDQMVLEKD